MCTIEHIVTNYVVLVIILDIELNIKQRGVRGAIPHRAIEKSHVPFDVPKT